MRQRSASCNRHYANICHLSTGNTQVDEPQHARLVTLGSGRSDPQILVLTGYRHVAAAEWHWPTAAVRHILKSETSMTPDEQPAEAWPQLHAMSRRALLGRELRRLRRLKGWTGPQLAEMLGWSQSKVSRLETGQRSAALADVMAWLNATETDGAPRKRVLDLAESLLGQVTGLRALHQGSLVRRQVELQSMDSTAQLVRQFQPLMAPGVFHTEVYARACIASANFTAERDLDTAVAARLERGRRVLSGEGPAYHVVMCESALSWRPLGCSPEQLRRLWHRVSEVLDQSNITLQVIPDGTPTAALPQCGFSVWDGSDGRESPLALVETPAAEVTFTSSEDVAMFERVWREMIKVALSPETSRDWITRIAHL